MVESASKLVKNFLLLSVNVGIKESGKEVRRMGKWG